VVEAAYFRSFESEEDEGRGVGEAPLALLVPTWALVLVNFYFGIDASLTAGVATNAARSLMGMLP
ncbi:MAG: monovalent cation/H+ antiporter subunit D family protein, partial [Gemmatimonadota bacterium]